jgi:hypothetical protein
MAVMHARTFVVLMLILMGTAISAPLRAQTLAEVAKKEEERRKAVPAPAKVYTNKDLNAQPAGPPEPPPPATALPAKPAADAEKDTKKDTKDEKGSAKDQAFWAGRMKALHDQVERDQNYADAMQTRINSLTADFAGRDDPAQRGVIARDRQKSVAELARLKKHIEDAKKGVVDLEEEARRAGVPPGWLR